MKSVKQELHRGYLQSALWQSIREKALKEYGSTCRKCGSHGTDVHHKTYARWGGNERLGDLTILCRDCHEVHHSLERSQASSFKKPPKATISAKSLWAHLSTRQKEEIAGGERLAAVYSAFIDFNCGHAYRKKALKFTNYKKVVGLCNKPKFPKKGKASKKRRKKQRKSTD